VKDGENMTYILRKYKNIFFITLILVLSFSVWYIFTSNNINKIPEKADLVLNHTSILRSRAND